MPFDTFHKINQNKCSLALFSIQFDAAEFEKKHLAFVLELNIPSALSITTYTCTYPNQVSEAPADFSVCCYEPNAFKTATH